MSLDQGQELINKIVKDDHSDFKEIILISSGALKESVIENIKYNWNKILNVKIKKMLVYCGNVGHHLNSKE